MAYKLRKIYTSQDQFRLDVAKSNDLFDEEYYELSKESGQDSQYAELLAATKDNVSSSFDKTVYDKLSGSDRFNYLVTENFMDKTSEDYSKNKAYFDQRIEQIKNQEIYDSLSDFEKVVNSVGGWLANTVVTPVLGMVEGLVDAGAFVAGVFGDEDFENKMKDFIARDTVGYQAVQQALNDYTARYTFNDKNWFSKAFNDISAGIARMTPMIVGNLLAVPTAGVSAVIGNTIYYASMAGNTAEEAIHVNPDIDYGALFGYTAGSVGLEMLTEWVSGKLFGDDIVSAMLKGQKYTPKGSIFNAVLHNFGTEALEEATAELFGSMLYRRYVDQDEDLASFSDIFYAALIGGLTGAIMTGGNIAFATKRYSVVDGKLIANNKLTEDQRKKAKKISFSNLYALRQLSEQTQTKESEVTKLMAKYGKSVDDIRTQHATEYDKAIKQDTETKKNQASAIIALANLMRDIGVEQFQRSSKLLEADIAEATTMVDNYFNHIDIYNKAASDAYSAAFPGQSYTPAAQIANEEQALAKALREAYPGLKVSFGTFGSSDGSSVRLINGTEGWLFIESGLVAKQGFSQILSQTIKFEIATDVMNQINLLAPEHADALASLATEGRKTKFSELTRAEKKAAADLICFDPINNRRIFQRDNKLHSKIFNYITKETDKLDKFGRKTESNKIKFRHLLEMRNMFIKSVADTIGNDEDLTNIKKQYNLTDEEFKTRLEDKFIPTLLNENVKLSELLLSEEAIHRHEAIDELLNNRQDTDLTTPFDWNNLYNEEYYSEEYVATIKEQQKTKDFETALSAHIKAVHNVEFNPETRNLLYTVLENQMTADDINALSKALLVEDARSDLEILTDTIYNIIQEKETTQNTDSVVVKDNQIQGTGEIHFFKGDIYDRSDIVGREQRRVADTSSERPVDRVVGKTRRYIDLQITDFAIKYQDETTLDRYQKELVKLTKQAYGLDLVFYAGPIKEFSDQSDNHQVLGFVMDGTPKVYVKDDSSVTLDQIMLTIRHEVTHKLIAQDKTRYNNAKTELENLLGEEINYWYGYFARPDVYGDTYHGNQTKIDEEVVVGYLTNQITTDETNQQYIDDKIIKDFYEGVESKLWTNEIWSISKMNGEVTFRQEPKKKTPNITEKDISKLASTEYRSGEKRKSKAKGYEDVEYEVASVMDYEEKNGDTLRKIKTLDDLKTVLKAIETGAIGKLESGFVLDLLQSTVLPFNFKGDRYASAKALLDPVQSARVTETAQEMASRSELFAETNPMKSLADELSEKFGAEIKPSDKTMIKWVPMYADRTNWLNRLKAEYDQIFDKRKNTKDPYVKQQYTLQLQDLRTMIQAVADNDTATILDLTMKQLQDTDENRAKNAEKVQELVKDFVADLISHTDTSGKTVKYDPNKKYILKPENAEKIADFWNKVNGFRYLAMLSSPATWGRNALTNTLITTNAIVEDAIGGKIEKTNFLRNESQANFTGDYDDTFSKFVEDRYKSRIAMDTKGDKYHTSEIEMVRQEWAAENDPLKKSKLLYTIKQLEQKALNDQPWTTRRVMRNLKNSLAGSINMLSMNAYAEVKALYKGSNAQEILTNMREKGSPLADLFERVYVKNEGKDMVGVVDLASKLANTSSLLDQIYDNALYRGNKLLFKTENVLSKKIGQLRKKHPMTAALISMFIPFAKTSYNTTAYIVNHSPIGLVKGVVQALQTKNMYIGDMRQAIKDYHKTEYIKQQKAANQDFTFKESEFDAWANTHLSSDVVSALNGDYNSVKSVFNQYVELGRVNQNLIGSSDIFARATTIESVTQGLTGTAWMALGLILGAMCKGFKIDEDDYLGPVLMIGNLRFKLDDLSPFSTMFSVGAVINSSENFLDGFEKFAGILIDASMLNVVESAIQYSDSLPDYLGNQQINFVQQFIPAIFKSFTKVIDNSKKNKSGNFYEKLIKTTLSNTPFFSYLVADKIDPYTGETDKIYQSGLIEALFHTVLPISIRPVVMSDYEREARKVGAETTGFNGRFSVNDVNYTVKNTEKYSKYRADYIKNQFNLIVSGKQKVTVEDENGKRITTTYDKLNDKQKKNVINRLYTDATNVTKIQWWIDSGNKYVVTDRDTYYTYRSLFKSNNIVYKTSWNKSKFVES